MTTLPANAARPGQPPRPVAGGPSISAVTINPMRLVVQYRYWLIAALIVGVVLGIGSFIVLRKISPMYRATTVYQTLPPVSDPTKPEVATVDREEFDRHSQTQARIMTSETLLRNTIMNDRQIDSTRWAAKYMVGGKLDPAAAAEALEDIVRSRVITGTSLIELYVTTSVPEDAKIIAECIHRSYFNDLRNQGAVRLGETREGLTAAISKLEGEIRRVDQLITQRMAEHGITTSSSNDTVDVIVVRLQSLSPMLAEVTSRLERAKVRLATLNQQLKPGQQIVYTDEQREDVERDPVILNLKQSLSQIEAALAAKRQQGLGESHKEVIAYRTLAEETQARLNTEREAMLRKLFDSEFDKVRQAVDGSEAEFKKIAGEYSELSRKRQDISRALQEIDSLKADREKFLYQLSEHQRSLADLGMMDAATRAERVGRVRRVEVPRTPERLYFPRIELMLPLGVLLVVGLTVGVVVIRELVDQRVKGPADVALVRNVRLVGVIPAADEDPTKPANVMTAFRDSPSGAVTEGFRQARAQLVKRMHQAGHKSLLVLSGAPGSGASTAVSNLAMGMAASEIRVLVIDANVRRPALHKVFKLAEGPGLGEILNGKSTLDAALQRTSIPNITLLAAGAPAERALPERLATEAMAQVIRDASARYDVVLIDTAPATVAGEGLALANRCDAAVLVVRAFSEKRGLIARLRDQLTDAKADFLGVIVNGVRGSSGGYLRKNIKASYEYQGTA